MNGMPMMFIARKPETEIELQETLRLFVPYLTGLNTNLCPPQRLPCKGGARRRLLPPRGGVILRLASIQAGSARCP